MEIQKNVCLNFYVKPVLVSEIQKLKEQFRQFKDSFSRKIWETENSRDLHTVANFATTEYSTTFYYVSLVGWLDYLLICQNGGMNLTKSFHEYIHTEKF